MGARFRGHDGLVLKWPNDLLLGGAKLSGILLETATGQALAIGIGVNLAHHPKDTEFPATSFAGLGVKPLRILS